MNWRGCGEVGESWGYSALRPCRSMRARYPRHHARSGPPISARRMHGSAGRVARTPRMKTGSCRRPKVLSPHQAVSGSRPGYTGPTFGTGLTRSLTLVAPTGSCACLPTVAPVPMRTHYLAPSDSCPTAGTAGRPEGYEVVIRAGSGVIPARKNQGLVRFDNTQASNTTRATAAYIHPVIGDPQP